MGTPERDPSRPAVIIVGAGLAGLSCALHLHRAERRVLVLEGSDGVGGRVRTDVVDGFRLDRGFQVLLSAYPEARSILDLDALRLRSFSPGALIRMDKRFHLLGDPFRNPGQAVSTLRAPVGSLGDKLRVAGLRWGATRGSVERLLDGPDIATDQLLRQSGMGSGMIERFFRPFLGGIFLERELATSSRMFRFVFRMFSTGQAAVPELGMEEIPRQLAAKLRPEAVRLHAPVESVTPGQVILQGGEVIEGERIVVATDGDTASELVEGIRAPRWCGVTCLYFATGAPPIREPILILDGEGRGPVNNLCFPTQVSPAYGPDGGTLVSASVLDDQDAGGNLVDRVRAQLVDWFGEAARGWRHLRTYRIQRALPRQLPGWLDPPERPVRLGRGIYVAGDHIDTASTNGALKAGRRAAEAVLRDLDEGERRR